MSRFDPKGPVEGLLFAQESLFRLFDARILPVAGFEIGASSIP